VHDIEAFQNAPAFAREEATISATVQEVWDVLSDLEKWPEWNGSVSTMKIFGPVLPNTEFHWVAGGIKIKSRIEEVQAPNRIAWSGRTMGIKAVHVWELSSVGDLAKVRTEESFQGLIVRLFARRMNNELAKALRQGLGALKSEAERRHGERMA
jgi:hypothetical protein